MKRKEKYTVPQPLPLLFPPLSWKKRPSKNQKYVGLVCQLQQGS
jgi:hypothetical protein